MIVDNQCSSFLGDLLKADYFVTCYTQTSNSNLYFYSNIRTLTFNTQLILKLHIYRAKSWTEPPTAHKLSADLRTRSPGEQPRPRDVEADIHAEITQRRTPITRDRLAARKLLPTDKIPTKANENRRCQCIH